MLRSMLAQMEFCYVIRQYDHGGISFGMYLHVLEEDPETGTTFLERGRA